MCPFASLTLMSDHALSCIVNTWFSDELPLISSRVARKPLDIHCSLCLNQQTAYKDQRNQFPLTKEEAIVYLEKVLQIPHPLKQLKTLNKFEFLCKVQRQTKIVQPFTLLHYILGTSCPSMEQTKKMMFERQGGGCVQINMFTKVVLQRLGYKAYAVGGSLLKMRTPVYTGHCGFLVQDVTHDGSLHLVELGTPLPILHPILLNFPRTSTVHQLINHRIRLFRDCPGIVRLCLPIGKEWNPQTDGNIYNEEGELWRTMIIYRVLEELDLEYCCRMLDILARDAMLIPDAHKELVIFGYSSSGLWTEIKGKSFVQYHKSGQQIIKDLNTNEEVVKNANRCFPQYSKDLLQFIVEYNDRVNEILQTR